MSSSHIPINSGDLAKYQAIDETLFDRRNNRYKLAEWLKASLRDNDYLNLYLPTQPELLEHINTACTKAFRRHQLYEYRSINPDFKHEISYLGYQPNEVSCSCYDFDAVFDVLARIPNLVTIEELITRTIDSISLLALFASSKIEFQRLLEIYLAAFSEEQINKYLLVTAHPLVAMQGDLYSKNVLKFICENSLEAQMLKLPVIPLINKIRGLQHTDGKRSYNDPWELYSYQLFHVFCVTWGGSVLEQEFHDQVLLYVSNIGMFYSEQVFGMFKRIAGAKQFKHLSPKDQVVVRDLACSILNVPEKKLVRMPTKSILKLIKKYRKLIMHAILADEDKILPILGKHDVLCDLLISGDLAIYPELMRSNKASYFKVVEAVGYRLSCKGENSKKLDCIMEVSVSFMHECQNGKVIPVYGVSTKGFVCMISANLTKSCIANWIVNRDDYGINEYSADEDWLRQIFYGDLENLAFMPLFHKLQDGWEVMGGLYLIDACSHDGNKTLLIRAVNISNATLLHRLDSHLFGLDEFFELLVYHIVDKVDELGYYSQIALAGGYALSNHHGIQMALYNLMGDKVLLVPTMENSLNDFHCWDLNSPECARLVWKKNYR